MPQCSNGCPSVPAPCGAWRPSRTMTCAVSTSPPGRHGLLFVGECGRRLHAAADSAEEHGRWLALLPHVATPSCDEALVTRDETPPLPETVPAP